MSTHEHGPSSASATGTGPSTEEDVSAAITACNVQYAILTAGPNAGRIVDLSNPGNPSFIERQRFEQIFANQKLKILGNDGRNKLIPISALWLASPNRREYTEIVFEPPGSNRKVLSTEYNRFQGFAVTPKEGKSHVKLLQHIYENVCGKDRELFQWFVAWMADLVQAPGNKPGTAVVLRGGYGAGKTIIFEYLSKSFGPHALKLAQQNQITGKFNSHFSSAILVGIEEGFWAGEHAAESVLKDLITSQTLTVEPKFASLTTSSNHAHILVTANADWVVPAGIGDRRYAVFGVSSQRAKDKEYWAPIWDALYGDGPSHLLHFLLKQKYKRAILLQPPLTRAKLDQIEHSLDPLTAWWLDVLKDNWAVGVPTTLGQQLDAFGCEVDKKSVYDSYKAWCQDRYIRSRPTPDTLLWKRLRELIGCDLQIRRLSIGSGRQRVVQLPSRQYCQAAVAAAIGCDWSELELTYSGNKALSGTS